MSEFTIFGERLKIAMFHHNRISNVELSKQTGISEVTISRYRRAERIPGAIEIVKISQALNVSPNYLLGMDDDMNGHEKDTINVKDAIKFCESVADEWSDFQKKALDNIGKGDSYGSSFGAVAYGAKMESMYRHEIPQIFMSLSTHKIDHKEGN